MWREHVQAPREAYIGGWLAEPSFPDAQPEGNNGYLLDLGSTSIAEKGAVEIWIPTYPQCNIGDRIRFTFNKLNDRIRNNPGRQVCRYLYLKDPVHDQSGTHYKLSLQPLQCLLPARYEAFYMVTSRTNNVSLSKRVTVDVVNTPSIPVMTSQITLFGQYRPGPVASWVISNGYRLAPENVVFQSIGAKSSASPVSLGIYQVPAGQMTGRLFATLGTLDGKTWTYDGNGTQLARGDVVCVQLEGEDDAAIYLAAAM